MTQVRFRPRVADGVTVTGVGAKRAMQAGSYFLVPLRAFDTDGGTVLPIYLRLPMYDTPEVIVLAPSDLRWVWVCREVLPGKAASTRYVSVPDTTSVLDYEDLLDVDPMSLEPSMETIPAWEAAVDAAQAAAIAAASNANAAAASATAAADTATAAAAALTVPVTFGQTKSSLSWPSGSSQTDIGTWTGAGGFTTSGTGLAVPADGSYLVQVTAQNFTAAGGAYLGVGAGGVMLDRNRAVDGADFVSATAITPVLTAGDVLSFYRRQNSGSSTTATFAVRITKI